jgi:hypothetical protein
MLLDISDERDHAPFWCFAVVIVMLAVTYFSGRFANRWKHDVMRAAGRK